MEKLFEALRERHPGYEVVDVRFTINPNEVTVVQSLEQLDVAMAKAIREAKEVDISSLF